MIRLTGLTNDTNSLSPLVPLSNPKTRLHLNYNLKAFRKCVVDKAYKLQNSVLIDYIDSVLSLTYNDVFKYEWSKDLPKGFALLRSYKRVCGIYAFVHSSGATYIGSSVDLWRRLSVQHKNYPFRSSTTNKHGSFYKYVVKYTWGQFKLYILNTVPNHLTAFNSLHPSIELTEEEKLLLGELNLAILFGPHWP